MEQKKIISSGDKTLITGLTDKNKPKQAPEYRAESPYAYPSFKIHKLTAEEILQKKVPPVRLIHASKFSPLYRAEKWTSPYLTKLSRKYCEKEFILDRKELLRMIDDLNNQRTLENQNVHLFTLDVEKLYPSIQPELALKAIEDLLESTRDEEEAKLGEAILSFVKLSFDESYVTYKDEVYKPKVGIPTGGSLSRQIADSFLHWTLFKKIDPSLMNSTQIRFWKRFIDDCIGIWRGSRRAFESFVKKLNEATKPYGIHFPLSEMQFGDVVHFLDITLYLSEGNIINYRSYTKPTDAKRYLRPQSFHPKNVFRAVPFSQMISTLERNSEEGWKEKEMAKMIEDFQKSGYNNDELVQIKNKAIERFNNPAPRDEYETITFSVHYFNELKDFRKILNDSEEDIQTLIGDTKIVVAIKKNQTIGNMMIRNKQLCTKEIELENQKCNAQNCQQCPLVNTSNNITINNMRVRKQRNLNCKSRNILYLWQCLLCEHEDSYIGRTIQKSHERTNTHRGCFTDEKWESSALSMHSKSVHANDFDLRHFRITLLRKVSPQRIRREEFKLIDKYRTRTLGINRYKN